MVVGQPPTSCATLPLLAKFIPEQMGCEEKMMMQMIMVLISEEKCRIKYVHGQRRQRCHTTEREPPQNPTVLSLPSHSLSRHLFICIENTHLGGGQPAPPKRNFIAIFSLVSSPPQLVPTFNIRFQSSDHIKLSKFNLGLCVVFCT